MLERPGRVSEARIADRLQLSYKHTCIISLELRPKTGETVSSAYTNEGRLFQTVRARRGAAWEPTSSNPNTNTIDNFFVRASVSDSHTGAMLEYLYVTGVIGCADASVYSV